MAHLIDTNISRFGAPILRGWAKFDGSLLAIAFVPFAFYNLWVVCREAWYNLPALNSHNNSLQWLYFLALLLSVGMAEKDSVNTPFFMHSFYLEQYACPVTHHVPGGGKI